MKRLFWVALGASVGVLLVRSVRRRAQKLTPSGLAEAFGSAASDLAGAVRSLADEVRAAAAEREAELADALDLPDREGPADRTPARRATA